MKTILELADDYAKAYFMGKGEVARKLLQAEIMRQELQAHLTPLRCELCRYQHGHAIGCGNNPVDIAMRADVPSTADQLRDEYASGLDSPTPDDSDENLVDDRDSD